MTIAAGNRIKAADFGFASTDAILAADYSVTSTVADVGLSRTITTPKASQQVLITLNAYVACATAVTAHTVIFYANIDGTNESDVARWIVNTTQNATSLSISRAWLVTLGAAGSHTIKVQANCTTTNDFVLKAAHSSLIVVPVIL